MIEFRPTAVVVDIIKKTHRERKCAENYNKWH